MYIFVIVYIFFIHVYARYVSICSLYMYTSLSRMYAVYITYSLGSCGWWLAVGWDIYVYTPKNYICMCTCINNTSHIRKGITQTSNICQHATAYAYAYA